VNSALIWRDRPPPNTYHHAGPRGLFLPAIINEEEWYEFTLNERVAHECHLYNEHDRHYRAMGQLYGVFWGELA